MLYCLLRLGLLEEEEKPSRRGVSAEGLGQSWLHYIFSREVSLSLSYISHLEGRIRKLGVGEHRKRELCFVFQVIST